MSTSAAAPSSSSSFPAGSRVTLRNLSKAEYNGLEGTVRSALNSSSGRQEVYVASLSKSVALRPANLRYVPREVDDLTVKEMKTVLRSRGVGEGNWTGMDKGQLAGLVRDTLSGGGGGGGGEGVGDEAGEEVARILAEANAPKASASSASNGGAAAGGAANGGAAGGGGGLTPDSLRAQADTVANMSPAQLRSQAAMLKSMDPASIRRMNPQMAGMSDAQIRMAAQQMEMMADNPNMMKMAAEQMKNMSREDVENVRRQAAGMGLTGGTGSSAAAAAPSAPAGYGTTTAPAGGSVAASAAPTPSAAAAGGPAITKEQLQSQAEQLSSLSPDQLRQQAQMLRSMTPSALRAMNPQMAGMSDAQIKVAADQMDMMAQNPEMVKMAAEQMKGMSPEELKNLQGMGLGGGGAGGAANGGAPQDFSNMNPSDLLQNMDPKQVKASLEVLKKNPEMMKQVLKSNPSTSGMSEEQLQKSVDAFANMDEKQLERAMGWLAKFQTVAGPVQRVWGTVNNWCGGHLGRMLVFGMAYLVVRWISGYFLGGGGAEEEGPAAATSAGAAGLGSLEGLAHKRAEDVLDQDEFGGEF